MNGCCPGTRPCHVWEDLPGEVRKRILGYVSLAELARLATLCKGLHAAYRERLAERQACIEARMADEVWEPEVTEGLSQADMAVPRDLIVDPPVCLLIVSGL